MENNFKLLIGHRIREQREYLGYSREKLAEMLELSPRFLNDVEKGVKGMSVANLVKACDILKVSMDYILLGREETTDNSRIVEAFKYVDEKYVERAEELLKLFIRSISD